MAGMFLEDFRNNKVSNIYQLTEVSLLDANLQSDIYSSINIDCDSAIKENIDFADKIYSEAKILDNYQKASILTGNLRLYHQKYDLLRARLLLNSLKIRDKCSSYYDELLYIYKYNTKSQDIIEKEAVFSKVLSDVKEKKGQDVLLIPIAGDTNSSAINLLMSKYNVSINDLPIIIINSKIKITELENKDQLMRYLGNRTINLSQDSGILKPQNKLF